MQYMDNMTDNPYPIYVGKQVFSEAAKHIIFGILIIIFTAIFLLFLKSSFNSFVILIYLGSFIFISIISLVYNLLYLNALSYSITNLEFRLKGGIISRFEKVLPYSKIQHLVITRSFMQKLMGLSTVVIQTAGSNMGFNYANNRNQDPFAGSPRIPGLDKDDAEKLRDYIIAQVIRSKSGQGI